MRTFNIVPMVSVGPIHFGMARKACRDVIGEEFETFKKTPKSAYATDAFDALGIHVYYTGKKPVVDFIELWFEDDVVFEFDGADVFRTNAPKLVKLLAAKSEYEVDDTGYVFPDIQIALYRESPYDPEYDDFDRWEAFSVGRKGYYPKRKTRKKN